MLRIVLLLQVFNHLIGVKGKHYFCIGDDRVIKGVVQASGRRRTSIARRSTPVADLSVTPAEVPRAVNQCPAQLKTERQIRTAKVLCESGLQVFSWYLGRKIRRNSTSLTIKVLFHKKVDTRLSWFSGRADDRQPDGSNLNCSHLSLAIANEADQIIINSLYLRQIFLRDSLYGAALANALAGFMKEAILSITWPYVTVYLAFACAAITIDPF